jgi:hypothetical protein
MAGIEMKVSGDKLILTIDLTAAGEPLPQHRLEQKQPRRMALSDRLIIPRC